MKSLLRLPGIDAKPQASTKSCSLLSIVATLIALCGGCATGPKYVNTEQQNSANVEGFSAPNQTREDGNCVITISKVDGFGANFSASHPGNNWPLHTPHLYLALGTHALTLDISDLVEEYGSIGHGETGDVGSDAYGSNSAITAEFTANHIYRFSGYLGGRTIELVLWDETDGAAARTRAGSWTFDSNGNHTDSALPSGGRH